MREPTPAEAEFIRLSEEIFAFLRTVYACSSEIDNDVEGVTVRYHNAWLAVELRFEVDQRCFIDLVPLDDGRLPPRFDPQGNEPLTRFPLAELAALCEPSWKRPVRENVARDAEDLAEVLRHYAALLERCGDRVLRGDREAFARIEAKIRGELITILLRDWGGFVERVRRGYTGGIGEYTLAITSRGQLENILENWRGEPKPDAQTALMQLDRAFDESTEPISMQARSVRQTVTLVPDSKAMRWWRRPKILVGPLRDHFAGR